jgi:thioredoxin-dependent peroxiredoxin
MSVLKEGDIGPLFSLKDKDGRVHKLGEGDYDYRVIYFYPKDNTPGCTLEARDFSKKAEEFKKIAAEVIGISGGDEKSKTKFCTKNNLKITLLSDPDYEAAGKYGVYQEKSFMGKRFKGVQRKTFVLDRSGKVLKIFDKVKILNHAEEILNFIKQQAG